MNRTLSFQQHVEYVVRKVEKRCNFPACLANTGWGWKKRPMRSVYLATQCNILDYAAPVWQPWIAKTQMDRLERAQNQVLRRITGQTASSPVEALRIEAGLTSSESPETPRSRRRTETQALSRQLAREQQEVRGLTPRRTSPPRSAYWPY